MKIMEKFKYKAFISHSHAADGKLALRTVLILAK